MTVKSRHPLGRSGGSRPGRSDLADHQPSAARHGTCMRCQLLPAGLRATPRAGHDHRRTAARAVLHAIASRRPADLYQHVPVTPVATDVHVATKARRLAAVPPVPLNHHGGNRTFPSSVHPPQRTHTVRLVRSGITPSHGDTCVRRRRPWRFISAYQHAAAINRRFSWQAGAAGPPGTGDQLRLRVSRCSRRRHHTAGMTGRPSSARSLLTGVNVTGRIRCW